MYLEGSEAAREIVREREKRKTIDLVEVQYSGGSKASFTTAPRNLLPSLESFLHSFVFLPL